MKAQDRKAHIIACARKVFARYGYTKTNVAMICQQAGIGRGTLYQYFANKKAVFEAIIDDLSAKAAQIVDEEVKPVRTKEEFFHHQCERLARIIQLIRADRDFARVAFGVASEFPKIKGEIDQFFIGLLRKEMELGQRMGIISPGVDTELMAIKHFGGTEKILTHYFINNKGLSKEKMRHIIDQVSRLDMFGYHHFDDYPDIQPPD